VPRAQWRSLTGGILNTGSELDLIRIKFWLARLWHGRDMSQTLAGSDLVAAPQGSAAPLDPAQDARRAIATWLLLCCVLVFAIVVVGGVTRLTRSGLSITEWQPILGTLPPLSEADWSAAFDKYRQTPEYQQVNRGMVLAEFKGIFWWEYFHRLLGRAVGVAFFVPFVWFLVRRRLSRPLAWRLAGVFALGAAQGALGWFMVMSGLIDEPRVSHLRLTAHLGLALAIYAAMWWIALRLLAPPRATEGMYPPGTAPAARIASLARHAKWLAVLVFVMALSGAMVAGLRAGFAYNTFPLMNGQWIPSEIMTLEPWPRNFVYNMATVQFVHRALAWLLMLAVPLLWLAMRRAPLVPRARLAGHALVGALALQVALGIATLVNGVPLALAALHQAGAVLLLSVALWVAFELRRALP